LRTQRHGLLFIDKKKKKKKEEANEDFIQKEKQTVGHTHIVDD
jgi:hypothetical protein